MRLNEEAFDRLKKLNGGISKRRAARILFDEEYFKSFDSARSFVKDHTGNGKNKNSLIAWQTDVPQAEESEFKIHEMPKDTKGILFLCDIHIPFHDEKTITKALKRKDDYNTIIIQEVFDFFQLSKFSKHKTIDIAFEQESFFQFMEWLREQVPKHKIYFQFGNHDERFHTYVMRKARELENLVGMEFETIFNFDEYKIEKIPMRNLLKYRDLYIGHGHEINARGVPVSPARTFYLKTKGNYIGGHFHRTSEFITRSIKDDVMGCWSVGCACDLHPMYAPVNEWNNGYAIIHPAGDSHFRVENVKIF